MSDLWIAATVTASLAGYTFVGAAVGWVFFEKVEKVPPPIGAVMAAAVWPMTVPIMLGCWSGARFMDWLESPPKVERYANRK